MSWRDDAACRGLSGLFFADEHGDNMRAAKRVCAGCAVRVECLDAAMARGEQFGCWGGMSPGDRLSLHRTGRRVA